MKYDLEIKDVLGNGYIEVEGIEYDASVTATFSREHETAPISLEFIDIGPLSVFVPTVGGGELFKIDVMQLEHGTHRTLYKKICAAIEALALRRAQDAPYYKWTLRDGDL